MLCDGAGMYAYSRTCVIGMSVSALTAPEASRSRLSHRQYIVGAYIIGVFEKWELGLTLSHQQWWQQLYR
jgi:hypothetical protein